jgi:integrase
MAGRRCNAPGPAPKGRLSMQQEPTRTPRRVRQERGIYYRETHAGRRYEVTYTDSDGRQRWQVVGGGLKEARTERANIVSKLGRGERVAPTRATFRDVATAWLEAQTHLRPRTHEAYSWALDRYLLPRFGSRPIAKLDTQDVADLIAAMHKDGKAGWTIRGVLTPLSGIFAFAIRRGMIASNPIAGLERGERPKVERREMRTLDREEIGKLLDAAPANYRTILATAIMTGLRQGELLGLTWADIDFDAGLVRVRRQLDRTTMSRVEPKTPQAVREVVLIPTLGRMLRTHKLASKHSRESDYVFATATGKPLNYRNVTQRGLDKALERIGLGEHVEQDGKRRWRSALRWHDLRHTYASILVAQGANVVFVSRQLGHASPDITLKVYAHLFDHAEHAQRARDALEINFGSVLGGVV